MKSFLTIFSILYLQMAKAGTPVINDSSILYVIALTLLGGIIVIPYLSKFIKDKFLNQTGESDKKIDKEIERHSKK